MGNLRGVALRRWAQTLLLSSCLLVTASQLVPPAYTQSNDGAQPAPNLQYSTITLAGTERSREGYFQLQVNGLEGQQQFVIEQSSTAEFDSIEATFPPLGSFRQISLSGFDDGNYYFRARVEQGDGEPVYSNTHQLTVQHYPLWQALGLFGIGVLLFVALVVTLVRFHWRSQQTHRSEGAHG